MSFRDCCATRPATRAVRSSQQQEKERWKLPLAAELRIVVRTEDGVGDSPVMMFCLPSSSLHRKHPKAEPACPDFRRRAVSTILSRDGSIAATQHYLVTDSVESPAVQVRRVQQMPTGDIRRPPDDGIVDTKQLRREVQNSRLKPIVWPQTSGVGAPCDQIIQDIP
jgi:hypothetical protein